MVDIPFFLYWLTIAHMGLRLLLKNTKEEKNRIPLMKQQAPTDTYKRKLPIWLASNSFFNHSLTKGQKQKKEDIPVLTGISSLTWKKGGYLLSRFAGSTIGVSGLNFSVRNGKRWDTAAIATIISDSGIHTAQHYIGKRRIIPLTSNQQNIKKQTGMYMKKHPCEKKYRVPSKSFRAISSARLWRRRLYTCTLSTSSSLTTLIKEI